MPRVVLDTVVLVRALLNKHSPCGRLVFQYSQDLELVSSPALLSELVAVLNRPEIVRKSPLFRGVEMRQVLDLMGKATTIEPDTPVVSERDPKDAMLLELALASKASYLVSEDKDLLSLGQYEGTRIVTCIQLLDLLSSSE